MSSNVQVNIQTVSSIHYVVVNLSLVYPKQQNVTVSLLKGLSGLLLFSGVSSGLHGIPWPLLPLLSQSMITLVIKAFHFKRA